MIDERKAGSEEGPQICPLCGASDPMTTLLTSVVWYFACRRCEHRWRTDVKSKHNDDGDQACVMDARVLDVDRVFFQSISGSM